MFLRPVPSLSPHRAARPSRPGSTLLSSALAATILGGSAFAGYHVLDVESDGRVSSSAIVSSTVVSSTIVSSAPAKSFTPSDSRTRFAQASDRMAPVNTAPPPMVADALLILRLSDDPVSEAHARPNRALPKGDNTSASTHGATKRARLPKMVRVTGYTARKGDRLGKPTLLASAGVAMRAKSAIVAPRFVRPAKRLASSVRSEPSLAKAATRFAVGPETARADYSGLVPRVFAKLPRTAPDVAFRNTAGSDTMLRAFAPVSKDFGRASRFDALLGRPGTREFRPPIGPRDHAWAARPLGSSVFSAAEQHCLAEGIYFEARGESEAGQAAVAQVILNRVRAPAFPNTICGVVYQNKAWRDRCQFSFACDGKPERIASPRHFRIAQRIAQAATEGRTWFADVGSSTHYHADYVNPRWNRTMDKVATIGAHIFYRTKSGGWH